MTSAEAGTVYLVGAGPGDPELLTVKAKRLIESADVLLHDDLVSREVLLLANNKAQLFNVGKRCGQHSTTQAQIHELMTQFAFLGLMVVRLKGGDPSLFGRSGEEIEALRKAGLAVEVVPGISAALAAAASAQVSLTGRATASTVVFTTGHLCSGSESDDQHWKNIAGPRRTVVIYMPGRDSEALAQKLISSGFDPDTPCLAVSFASTANERKLTSTLREIGRHGALPAPSIFFVGEAVAEREERDREFNFAGVQLLAELELQHG